MLTLVLPHFLRAEHENLPPMNTPALNQILRFGQRGQFAGRSMSDFYCGYLGLNLDLPPNSVYASPIYQEMGMNTVSVLHGQILAIGQPEAERWCADLNQLYDSELSFSVIRPDLWRVDFPHEINWQIPAIFDVNHTLSPENAPADWLNLTTELQMYLHNHPLNQNRKPFLINGLWLWQKNSHVSDVPEKYRKLILTDSLWAQQSLAETVLDLPVDWASAQSQFSGYAQSDVLIFSDKFVNVFDSWEYVNQVHEWEQRFFAPMWAAYVSGSLKRFNLIFNQEIIQLSPLLRYAFWKRGRQFDGKI